MRPAGRSHRSPAEVIVGLQQLAGNQAVSSLMRNRSSVQRCGDRPCDCAESEAGEAVQQATGSMVVVSRQRAPATTAPQRGTAASAPRLDVRLSTNGSPCACVVFIHNNERNARLTAELMHDHCAYNLAIISPDATSRRITLPGHRSTVDPNELFISDIADRCVRDEQACRDFVTNNAGARDNQTIDRVVRTQFFLAIRDGSAGFSLPVVALHNNARDDTAAYSRELANQRRAGRDSTDLRMDVDKTGASEENQTVAEILRRPRTRFGANVQRRLTERAGSTNIFRWCASNDLSRCHIGDPDRPDNVIWTTNARDFEALSHTNVNVALQSQLPPGPGSESSSDLSTLFIVLRTLTPPSLQLLLDAIQHQQAIDEAELRAALQEIGRMNPATIGDAAMRAIAELLQITDGILRQGRLVADRLSRLRYVNIETPGLPLAAQSDAERVSNYQFIASALSTLGLDCCGPDPAAAHSRIGSGLRAPSAH